MTTANPFSDPQAQKSAVHVKERLDMLRHFGREELRRALQVGNLQPTVREAIQRRLRVFDQGTRQLPLHRTQRGDEIVAELCADLRAGREPTQAEVADRYRTGYGNAVMLIDRARQRHAVWLLSHIPRPAAEVAA